MIYKGQGVYCIEIVESDNSAEFKSKLEALGKKYSIVDLMVQVSPMGTSMHYFALVFIGSER